MYKSGGTTDHHLLFRHHFYPAEQETPPSEIAGPKGEMAEAIQGQCKEQPHHHPLFSFIFYSPNHTPVSQILWIQNVSQFTHQTSHSLAF